SLGSGDLWMLGLDARGNKLWENTYGGSADDLMGDLIQVADGGFLLAGSSSSTDGDRSSAISLDYDYWLLRLDSSGRKLWDLSLGGDCPDFGYSLEQTADGGFIFGGVSSS